MQLIHCCAPGVATSAGSTILATEQPLQHAERESRHAQLDILARVNHALFYRLDHCMRTTAGMTAMDQQQVRSTCGR